MAGTGSMTELERRLQKKAEEDRKRAERIYLAELETLSGNLRRRALEEASSIESAMVALTRPVAGTLRRLTLLFVALGVLLSLGIWGANLALVQWQSSEIESLREESGCGWRRKSQISAAPSISSPRKRGASIWTEVDNNPEIRRSLPKGTRRGPSLPAPEWTGSRWCRCRPSEGGA